jgi:hypothetical protein
VVGGAHPTLLGSIARLCAGGQCALAYHSP